jgi:hypothetical protein
VRESKFLVDPWHKNTKGKIKKAHSIRLKEEGDTPHQKDPIKPNSYAEKCLISKKNHHEKIATVAFCRLMHNHLWTRQLKSIVCWQQLYVRQ